MTSSDRKAEVFTVNTVEPAATGANPMERTMSPGRFVWLLVAGIVAFFPAPSRAEAVDLTANVLLSRCRSNDDANRLMCFSFVRGVIDGYTALAMTSLTAGSQQSSIAGICHPKSAAIAPRDAIEWTEQAVQEWRIKMNGKMDPMGEMPAGMVIIAGIRQKWPCN
jgi:hypothetical protein